MIHFKKVSKIYNGTPALANINLMIKPQEFISIVGQSGAGKSTMLRIMIGEEKPTKGSVFVNGDDVSSIPMQYLPYLRRKIGSVFQDYKLLSHKTVFENIAFALEVLGAPQKEIEEDVPKILKLVGMSNQRDQFPHQLSGGEKQRTAIGRALIHRPEIIVADEPTGNLDPLNTWDIIRLLLRINELGTTVILATHNKEVINTIEKRVIILDRGRIIRDEEKGRYMM